MEGYIGQVILFAGNFAPRGWAFCEGQQLAISNNTSLFAIIGTLYGGDGRSTFFLPDLRGRVPVGAGAGPGRTSYQIGATGGAAAVSPAADQPGVVVQPVLGMHYIICTEGIFPSRS